MGERMLALVSWSRLFTDREVLVAINTDPVRPVTAYSTVAPRLRVEGDKFHLVFWHAPKPAEPPPATLIVERRSDLLTVRMTLPPAGFVLYRADPGLERLGPRFGPTERSTEPEDQL
jgi:hypothetical protein